MRVMLVFPPNADVIEPFKSAKRKPPALIWGFPLGLGYLAGVLQEKGFEVAMFDACFDGLTLEEVMEKIKDYQPHIVGLGALTHVLRASLELAKMVKGFDRNIKVVFGGPHATYDYQNLLNLNCIDYIVIGEGEYTFLELCEKIKLKEPIDEIRGLAFRNIKREIIKNSYRPLIEDLDSLPFPARGLLDFNRYIKSYGVLEKSVDIVSSRGCTNRCVFCSSSFLYGRLRTRSPEHIILEIKDLVKRYPQIKSINFMDDNFTADKNRVVKFCNLMIANGLNTYSWDCLARVDQLDEDMAHLMRSAGCARVHLGIESGSPQILKNINKRITLKQARMAVTLLLKAKIEAYSFFMIGNPGETRETIELTRRFAKSLRSTNSGLFITQIYPGTRLEQLQPVRSWAEYIYEPEVNNPSIFTHPCIPNFIPEGFTRESLKKICGKITRELIISHFFRRYRLFIRKLFIEPRETMAYLFKVFFNR